MRALIIVDMQNDFCEGGPVPVTGAHMLARTINDYLASQTGYAHIVATKDFHIDPGEHFSDHPDFATSWPPHCRAGTLGAGFEPGLDTAAIEAVFRKGAYSAGYSGFEGVDDQGNPLLQWLRQRDIDAVDVVGVAIEHCVRHTAIDAARAGLGTRVLLDLTAGVTVASTERALSEMRTARVELIGNQL
ncbi:isochorismatase family protein [Mycobacterium vicinigordonae]|uniref:nicotinamidase n=1 Tax=Mycobacterium vicinigordonae TaxID=1719132 RepID=A0A7D6HXY4_9MYCO|nr:isochorismatase family protein [Mycobacterium vicinigordonae]QLL05414.1 isochorismatase family protein [Mycobacterium vicinigordonae]